MQPEPESRGGHPARWWRALPDGRLECRLCPRECKLRDGQRGFCFVRRRRGGAIHLATYGRSSGFCIDPIEKKPLNHFFPGTSAFSFGTAGCNLACRFCQNWDISRARAEDRLDEAASPEDIADAAASSGCRSVAFTYNDPVVFAEYAIDVARACRERDVRTVAVTAGYISGEARAEFFAAMDAANVDLKAFTDDFHGRFCAGRLQPVLDTLAYLSSETEVWLEVTTLLIPGANDSIEEIDRASDWFAANLGPDVPWHFTAFHPSFRLLDRPRTPPETLLRARDLARSKGLRYVYTGNIHDPASGSTWCPGCGALLIERIGYAIGVYGLKDSRCAACGRPIAGRFDRGPGSWGGRRQSVSLGPS